MKHNKLTETFLILSLTLCMLILPGQIDHARASSIVAIVNGAVITDFDIGQRQKLERLLSGGKKRLGRTSAINALIEDKLKLIEARNRKMSATDKQVDTALTNMARNVRMTEKRLVGIFKQAGINKETVKDWLKVQISWRALIDARFNAQVRVEEADIVKALRKDNAKDSKDSVKNSVEFDLIKVLFVTRAKASNRETSQRLTEAKRFRASFASCTKDVDTARRLKDVAVSRIGRRNSSDLHPEIAKTLRDTPLNKLTPPTKVDNGYEMLAVCGKKDLGKQATLRSEAETKLKDEQGKTLSRKYLLELRSNAIIEKR
ncbi:peptidylprolyl isomerase [Cohaesibacter celericrescens]|nr:peptidylprolyl isomerase [Cohaesibacter celericrescens]